MDSRMEARLFRNAQEVINASGLDISPFELIMFIDSLIDPSSLEQGTESETSWTLEPSDHHED